MARYARYQGAIVQDDQLLLIKHRVFEDNSEFWMIPGGGREAGETEEEAVIREMQEETNLTVQVERKLMDVPATRPGTPYQRWRTYLCTPIAGEAAPGYEPEEEAQESYEISAVSWFSLLDDSDWDKDLVNEPFIYPWLQEVRRLLGYVE